MTEEEETDAEGNQILDIIGDIEITQEQLLFFEDAIIGGIDGLTAYYAAECRQGMMTTTTGAFRLAENTDLLDPTSIMKMSLAMTNLLEGVNIVTAYCDFTAMIDSLMEVFAVENIST